MSRVPMHRLTAFLTIAALIAFAPFVAPDASAQDRDIRVADYDVNELTYPELREFDVPEPQRVELDNGLTIFLLEDDELPQVNAVARINTGSVHEPAEQVGLASVTGTTMRTGGTASMAPDEVNEALENVGATVETSIGSTSGSAFMRTLEETVDEVLPIFAEVLRSPAFNEDQINVAKSQQRSAIARRNDNPQQIAFRELDKIVYGEDSPYARTTEYYTLDAFDRDDIVDFHGEHIRPNNMLLSVWGDFDADVMEEKLREAFGDWPRAEDFEPPSAPEPEFEPGPSVNHVQKEDVTQSAVMMGHEGELTRDHPDYTSTIVMNEVLSGGFSGRLFQNVRRDQGLAYSVFGNYSAPYDRPGRFFAGVFSRSEKTVESAQSVLHEVDRLRESPPTDEEVELAKDSYLNSFVFNFDSKRQILSRLMTYEHHDYPSDFLQQTQEGVQGVTADDVQRVAQEYLRPDESHILVVGNEQDFDEPLATLADDGEVNDIDISIPTSPPEDDEPVAAEDLEAGQELLIEVREALGGNAFDRIENMRIATLQTAEAMGGQTIESEMTIQLPDRHRTETMLPTGQQLTVVDDGEQTMLETPQGTQPAPAPIRQQVGGELWRDISFLMANAGHEAIEAQDAGTQEIDGTSYRALRISPPVGDAYTLLLNSDTMRPERMEFQGMDPQEGPFEAMNEYGDYQEVAGVLVPFEVITYQDGEQQAETTIDEFAINVELDDELFTIDG